MYAYDLNVQSLNSKFEEEKFTEAASPDSFKLRSVDDSSVYKRRSSLLSKSGSRRSHTPQARPTYLSKIGSRNDITSPTKGFCSLSKSTSRREQDSSPTKASSSSRRIRCESAPEIPANISRTASRRSTTPIVFSQTTARKKPPPIERKLDCTIEELCHGSLKNIKITRDVITDEGIIVQQEEILTIKLKPGWKKGTKITFEGKGNEKPGYLPADIIFLINEKRHPLFKRRGDDLEIAVQLPLVNALTGCTLSVPLLGGDKMTLSVTDIVYPGYLKVIPGQGMPNPKSQDGKRGDLIITFLVNFPQHLTHEQRSLAFDILNHCSE
ncbi:dnaJ homolog subfamily B member 13 [Carica papaya]|uniref:dnaJ homolog subfamily B member 13 n=1 Tax=Carica papaya TaxID=3649 RepID=UPI000B8C9D46|nr:dnaJ homolog subfamily B member 13 [Carica papaya]